MHQEIQDNVRIIVDFRNIVMYLSKSEFVIFLPNLFRRARKTQVAPGKDRLSSSFSMGYNPRSAPRARGKKR